MPLVFVALSRAVLVFLLWEGICIDVSHRAFVLLVSAWQALRLQC
jgi:hypothetical protein